MQGNADLEAWRARLRRRLAVVVDEGLSYRIRISAVKAIQAMMSDHSISRENPDDLLARVLRPWQTRERLIGNRMARVPVTRPPVSVMDVWEL